MNEATCDRAETSLTWRQTGPPGPQGPGPSQAFVTEIGGYGPLPHDVDTRLLEYSVPAGDCTIEVFLSFYGYGEATVNCELINSPDFDIEVSSPGPASAFAGEHSMPLAGWVSWGGGGGTIIVDCHALYQPGSLSAIYVDDSPVLVTKVGNLVRPPAPPPPDLQARSAANDVGLLAAAGRHGRIGRRQAPVARLWIGPPSPRRGRFDREIPEGHN